MSEDKIVMVTLKTKVTKERKKSKDRSFPISQANTILKLANSQWELNDKDFKWNGKEIAIAKK